MLAFLFPQSLIWEGRDTQEFGPSLRVVQGDQAVWLGASTFPSLGFSFLIFEVGVVRIKTLAGGHLEPSVH